MEGLPGLSVSLRVVEATAHPPAWSLNFKSSDSPVPEAGVSFNGEAVGELCALAPPSGEYRPSEALQGFLPDLALLTQKFRERAAATAAMP
ncbi:MAG: hypothetical protein AUJ92_11960 [Armatimonadetes bacterium CG2_30_59_28]|nr:MAG: hypothetical protein AUJ92_11960 [Armatimonadetes bacterium CG2_30_59_28]PIU66292.1 MAG: hypothetical protein COS85_05435 [Armatimonadetes bacterium CG07_land_8_20_14_0_80_59_28]PIY49507.1 MAG: hypothetical protein COZ05_00185 [Armatimonadetes bacterium CG_4_10_14_3_um_filter_59_10]